MSMGDMIGGALQLAGGLFGSSEAEDAIDEQHWQFQENQKQQREFAQHGVQWRVEDAKAAGLHPLFALGANPASFSPVPGGVSFAGSPFGEALGRMGQDISRASLATATPEQRELQRLNIELVKAQIYRTEAEGLAAEARAYGQVGQIGPGMPPQDPNVYAIPGQVNAGVTLGEARSPGAANIVEVKPSEAESYAQGRPDLAAARNPLAATFRGPNGDILLPSKAATEAIESVSESLLQQYMWLRMNLKNNPNFMRENAWLIPGGEGIYAALEARERGNRWRAAHAPGPRRRGGDL